MRILIAHGSKRGGTAGLAEMIGAAFDALGFETAVRPAGEVRGLGDVDAVVIAGALYANRWHRDARRLVRRKAAALRDLPVWLVASGPLDDSAATGELLPAPQLSRAAESIGARGTVVFGGRLAPDAKGFPAAAMARKGAGDWRDPEHVRRWVAGVAAELGRGVPSPGA